MDVEECKCHHEVGLVVMEARGSVAKQDSEVHWTRSEMILVAGDK